MSCPYNCITLPLSLLFRKIPYLLVKMPVGRDSVVEQFSKGINICIVSYILDIMDRDEYNHKQSLICDCLWYNQPEGLPSQRGRSEQFLMRQNIHMLKYYKSMRFSHTPNGVQHSGRALAQHARGTGFESWSRFCTRGYKLGQFPNA